VESLTVCGISKHIKKERDRISMHSWDESVCGESIFTASLEVVLKVFTHINRHTRPSTYLQTLFHGYLALRNEVGPWGIGNYLHYGWRLRWWNGKLINYVDIKVGGLAWLGKLHRHIQKCVRMVLLRISLILLASIYNIQQSMLRFLKVFSPEKNGEKIGDFDSKCG
jgi:hypothetical protein